ncbi:MAG: hypothetical protein RQ824_10295 [bacterium]|nr:hypothetical protein [bacterium]
MLKKHLAALAVILTLPATALAGQIGGLADHMGGQLLTATVSVGVIDRDVKRSGTDDDYKMNVLSARVTYGLNDRVDLYATLGKANIDSFGNVDDSLEDIYGGGVKFLLFEGANKTRVILNADANFMETSDADYRDISGSVIISRKRGNLTPYGGVKVSAVEINPDLGKDWEEEKGTGFFAGLDYFVNPNVYFTGEIHVFAENTIFAGVGYNF